MRDHRIRLYENNQLLTPGVDIVAPDNGSFPIDNALNAKRRNLAWYPGSKTFTVTVDMGYNANVSLFSIMGPANEALGISTAATITIKGNMVNVFDGTEPLNTVVTLHDNGVFHYLDTDDSPDGVQYRYWEIDFDDSTNPDDVFINYLFLGDALRFNHNIERGFEVTVQDRTLREFSDSGSIYSTQRPQARQLGNLNHVFLDNDTKNDVLDTIQTVGLHTPFIIALDPTNKCFDPDFSHYLAYFNTLPQFIQVKVNNFNARYDILEAL